jgi:hypothetical protein
MDESEQKRMPDEFKYDVFLSHSSKDKEVVRPVAERLRKDGLLDFSFGFRVSEFGFPPLAACLSAHAFGSDWAQLEAGTFRFRDPLNKERRFIPLRLDNAPIKGSLAQFLHREQGYEIRSREVADEFKPASRQLFNET